MDLLLQNKAFMDKLSSVTPEMAKAYQSQTPFPHVVFDDFFPLEVVDRIHDAFPNPEQLNWYKFNNHLEKKLACSQAEQMPTVVREFLYFLNSNPMLKFVEQVTSIDAILPDPTFTGGGLHQIERGGKLGVHIDFNKLMPFNLDRRLNLICYLNKNWKEEYGGHFELWDAKNQGCVKKVLPIFNRVVIFTTNETSYHGHPEPLTCPEGWTRKSVAIYYYTNGRPDAEKASEHTTVFLGHKTPAERSLKGTVRYLTPPCVMDALRWCKRKVKG